MSQKKQNHQIPLTSSLRFNRLLATFISQLFIQSMRPLVSNLTLVLGSEKYLKLHSGFQRFQQNPLSTTWWFPLSCHKEAGTSILGERPLAMHPARPLRDVDSGRATQDKETTVAYLSQDAFIKLCYHILPWLGFHRSWSLRIRDFCLKVTLKEILLFRLSSEL